MADVSRALPIALRQQGADARLVLPGYNSAIAQLAGPKIEARLPASWGLENACLISGLLPGSDVPVWLIHAPTLYCRAGGVYQDGSGQDWSDNPYRFSYLARVATALALGQLSPWKADLLRAIALFGEPLAWRRLQLGGMMCDFGWKSSAIKYLSLYEEASGLFRPVQEVYDFQEECGSLQREVRSTQGVWHDRNS